MGKHAQLVVMCLQPGEQIGREVHPNVDQFFRIEQGEAKFVFNETEEHLVRDADAALTWLLQVSGSESGGFFATHAGTADRIDAVRKMP